MKQRGPGWSDSPEGRDVVHDGVGLGGGLLPALPRSGAGPDEGGGRGVHSQLAAFGVRSPKELEMNDRQVSSATDRVDMAKLLNDHLEIDPRHAAVITIDCHRGHLDLAVATMPLAPQAAASVVAATARLLRLARGCGMSVIHVITQNRILPLGRPEALCNPFWAALEETRQAPISRHNLVGTVQTQLMPELGPEPGDMVIDRKRRLSIYQGTDLDMTLQELGIDTVLLAGINTNTCVLCAAFESLNRDLRTVVVSDCVQTMYGDELHYLSLQNIARCVGWVVTVDELAAKMEAKRALAR